MGIIQQVRCDHCGESENCTIGFDGKAHPPKGWFLVQWQQKTPGGFNDEGVKTYCEECGADILSRTFIHGDCCNCTKDDVLEMEKNAIKCDNEACTNVAYWKYKTPIFPPSLPKHVCSVHYYRLSLVDRENYETFEPHPSKSE